MSHELGPAAMKLVEMASHGCEEHLKAAEQWYDRNVRCEGCLSATNGKDAAPHNPLCLLFSHVTFTRGAHGKLLIVNAHHSVAGKKETL